MNKHPPAFSRGECPTVGSRLYIRGLPSEIGQNAPEFEAHLSRYPQSLTHSQVVSTSPCCEDPSHGRVRSVVQCPSHDCQRPPGNSRLSRLQAAARVPPEPGKPEMYTMPPGLCGEGRHPDHADRRGYDRALSASSVGIEAAVVLGSRALRIAQPDRARRLHSIETRTTYTEIVRRGRRASLSSLSPL